LALNNNHSPNIEGCNFSSWFMEEEFEDTKGVIRIHKGNKDKQGSTKHYTEN
jgi:hypothetical protein